MTTPLSLSITQSGAAGRQVLPLTSPDVQGMVVVSGAYAGLQLVIQAAYDFGNPGGPTWFNVPAIRRDNLLLETNLVLQSDGLTNAIAVGDGTTRAWLIPGLESCNALSVYAAALTTAPVNVLLRSGSFFANAPQPQQLGGLLHYQLLMQIALLLEWLKEPSGARPAAGDSADFTSGVTKLIK